MKVKMPFVLTQPFHAEGDAAHGRWAKGHFSRSLLLILSIGVIAAGCAGNGSDGGNPSSLRYTGTFASLTTSSNGTLDLRVGEDGAITGTTTDSRFSGNGTVIAGSNISGTGEIVLNVSYGSAPAVTKTTSGTLSQNGNTLSGTLTEGGGDSLEPFNYTLQQASE